MASLSATGPLGLLSLFGNGLAEPLLKAAHAESCVAGRQDSARALAEFFGPRGPRACGLDDNLAVSMQKAAQLTPNSARCYSSNGAFINRSTVDTAL